MMIQYCRTLKRMGRTESVFKNPNFQMAGVIFLLGIILLVTLIGDIILLRKNGNVPITSRPRISAPVRCGGRGRKVPSADLAPALECSNKFVEPHPA